MSKNGGYIAGLLLYGCALGAFVAPFLRKKIWVKKSNTFCYWRSYYLLAYSYFCFTNYMMYHCSWMLMILVAFLFGVCFQASWPLALYSQETEEGVTEANVGIAASLYISISNIGAAVLPVIFPILIPR